ncbi:MHYT domain-containing protein [Salinarimonas soli]|uniref:histidine kinase n=1 Tax=Salinarimonas soli TaxID=1638099 RepID=A0A5B2V7A7_9HYPH|nr:MHYT domain-containing protein [Salinarimonas soli]KAA2234851.1 PAS domain S-box protein [Salinarimonas soli]
MTHAGAHDGTLVALSILIATLASFTALDLASRIQASSGWAQRAWLATAAVAMGGGIWSMHFVAMLAFSLPGVEVTYDLPLTLFSLALPIVVTAFGFTVANRRGATPVTLALSGLVMGLGIAGMHYSGMTAMRLPADLRYESLWVAISVLIAIGAATVALWLAFRSTVLSIRISAAIAMGLAISGMHYASMQGAIFTPHAPVDGGHGVASVGQMHLALWVTATTFLILALALVAAMFDRHFATLATREAEALRASEERFRLLVQSVTDYAIFMLDREGRVVNWNAGARRFKGYEAEEIVGQHFSRFYTEEDQSDEVPKRALETAEREGKFEAEGWRVRKDGSRFWASVVVDPIRDDAGQVIGFAKVTRDITERKRSQEALEQAREALAQAQKMEALGQLTGGVAHDFNNLLMAVLGSLDLLKKRIPADPRTARLLENAIQGARRGAALTQRMLAFARRQELKPTAVSLPDLVRGMSDLLQRSIGPSVEIETRFPLKLPSALVDANQLELALLNLCVNARDAMPDGGRITISAWVEEQGASGEQSYVCLSVADTGAGMDDETLARALEPFFTTKGVGKGTGLGLPMVQGLAEQSNGHFVLKSRKGAGTTAEVWLPVAQKVAQIERAAQAAEPLREQLTRKLTVLVVDDDPLVRENTAAMLDDLGHEVIEARSGEEALGLVHQARRIDLVLTDHVMPGMTGGALASRLAEERPDLPIILASGYAELSGESGSALRLSKPFDQRALVDAISVVLAHSDEGGTVVPLRPRVG